MSAVDLYSVGICYASACAPLDTSREEIERAVNDEHPSGVQPWRISDEPAFSGGEPNPCPCSNDPERQHWLLVC